MNCIINVLRLTQKGIISSPIRYVICQPNQSQILNDGGSKWNEKNLFVNILAVTFQASYQEIAKSNLKMLI